MLRSSGALAMCESAPYDALVVIAVRRSLASELALPGVVAALGRVDWTGIRTAEDASGDRRAAIVPERDSR